MTSSSRPADSNPSSTVTAPESTLPKLLDTNKASAVVINKIFEYLTDTDLSRLAVNKELTERTLSDSRWIEKLRRVLFNGFYLNYLINQLGDGQSILDTSQIELTEEKDDNSREKRILRQVNVFLQNMKTQGVCHFQTIYARYRKFKYLDKYETLNEDKFILLTHHHKLINDWLAQNRNKILRNEPLGLEGRSAIFYLALSGYRDGLHLYHQFGFDYTVTDINGDSIQGYIGLSGNVVALNYCATELKMDMTKTTVHKNISVQHFIAKSGSAAALQSAKDHLKLNMKALTRKKAGVQQMAAWSGNTHSIWICQNKFKLPMAIVTKEQLGVQHFLGMSGSREAILMCDEMKLDMNLKHHSGKGLQHDAAASGKREALETCKELGLDMTLYTEDGLGVQHSAAAGGAETLRFCRDNGLDMQAETTGERKRGIQHILAIFGKPEDFKLCSELGLDIDKLDSKGEGFEHYAAVGGNRTGLQLFKNSGRAFRSRVDHNWGILGVQHAAAHGGDPLTILTCVEYGLEMKEEAGVRLGAEIFAAESNNPAALLMMQLLDLPIDHAVKKQANKSVNPTMRTLAQLMYHHPVANPYPAELKTEWDKIGLENRTDHIAAFFLAMSKKKNVSIFFDGFYLSNTERQILKQLPHQLQTMKEENLARVYIYLNYLHLNLVTSKKISYSSDETNTFTAVMRFAIDQVLNKIIELRKKIALEKTSNSANSRSCVMK